MCDKINIDIRDKQLISKVAVHKSNLLVTGTTTPKLYTEYQRRVSELLPVEEHRPNVILELGPKSCSHPIVLIGGMGPLSDASILAKLYKLIPEDTSVTLYSFPPPRKDPVAFFNHLICLKKLMETHESGKCFLLSNTAHVMFELFDQVVFKKTLLQLVNLVDIAAQHVSDASGSHDTLVLLTTLVSWRTELYESRITGFDKIIRCNSSDAQEIQRAVDLAKRGNGAGKKLLMRYLDKVMCNLKGKKVVVFLGCTDFVFLSNNLSKEIADRYSVTVYDTDAMFAEDIARVYDSRIKPKDKYKYRSERVFEEIYDFLERDTNWVHWVTISVLAFATLTLSAMKR